MPEKAIRVLRVYALALLLLSAKASPAAADQALQVPFEYATSRNVILLHVRINEKPALLILDTGSAHTVLQPAVLGINPAELAPTHLGPSGGGFAGDAIGWEVALQVGSTMWKKWRVAVMDLSQVLAAYSEKPDGVLGLDFFQEFSQVTINIKDKTITFIGESHAATAANPLAVPNVRSGLGQLKKLSFSGGNGHYALNGSQLPRITADAIDFETADQLYKVRASFLRTVAVSQGQPVDTADKELVDAWARQIPLVGEILRQKDPIGSLKPIAYDLIEPKDHGDLQLREELTLLWSADLIEAKRIGHTGLGPAMRFSEQLIDVQYRVPNIPADHLVGKAFLQILYLQAGDRPMLLGAFVIISNPSGEYEFYLVPRSVLDRIVIGDK